MEKAILALILSIVSIFIPVIGIFLAIIAFFYGMGVRREDPAFKNLANATIFFSLIGIIVGMFTIMWSFELVYSIFQNV